MPRIPEDGDSEYTRARSHRAYIGWKRAATIIIPLVLIGFGIGLVVFQTHWAARSAGVVMIGVGGLMLSTLARRGIWWIVTVRRQLRGACSHCGYPISGEPARVATCPECGKDPFE